MYKDYLIKSMPDYSQSKIYKLTCSNPDLVYYGSTTNYLSQRLRTHQEYSRYKGKGICKSKILFDAGNVEIELVEELSLKNKEELSLRERYYIENNPCVNKQIPGRNHKEWMQDNKDHLKDYNRNYYEKTKEKYHEKIKCECGCMVQRVSINRHKKSKKHIDLMNPVLNNV